MELFNLLKHKLSNDPFFNQDLVTNSFIRNDNLTRMNGDTELDGGVEGDLVGGVDGDLDGELDRELDRELDCDLAGDLAGGDFTDSGLGKTRFGHVSHGAETRRDDFDHGKYGDRRDDFDHGKFGDNRRDDFDRDHECGVLTGQKNRKRSSVTDFKHDDLKSDVSKLKCDTMKSLNNLDDLKSGHLGGNMAADLGEITSLKGGDFKTGLRSDHTVDLVAFTRNLKLVTTNNFNKSNNDKDLNTDSKLNNESRKVNSGGDSLINSQISGDFKLQRTNLKMNNTFTFDRVRVSEKSSSKVINDNVVNKVELGVETQRLDSIDGDRSETVNEKPRLNGDQIFGGKLIDNRPNKVDTSASSISMEKLMDNLAEDCSRIDDDDEGDISLNVLEDMSTLEESFPILTTDYHLLNKIGEGTFSTVYKAKALKIKSNYWRNDYNRKNPIVALKQIYVTSSPARIHNELSLLYILSGSPHVAPLLDVLRAKDQVIAILPFYQHSDFRDFYRDLPFKGIKNYLFELFKSLEFVHEKSIIHRDLKPTNFLYDPFKGKGVLVDFGLAEKESASKNSCPCLIKKEFTSHKRFKSAYPKLDQRPPRRANRAGTRGFRAPEVLFKCNNQSSKIDIWSAGIIALSLLFRKFPLFNSPDDTDALLELIIVFGSEKMKKCAELHGCGLIVNFDKLDKNNLSNGNLLKILYDLLHYEEVQNCFPENSVIYDTLRVIDENGLKKPSSSEDEEFSNYLDHKHLLDLLNNCFQMDPQKRLTAKQILRLPFFDELKVNKEDEIII